MRSIIIAILTIIVFFADSGFVVESIILPNLKKNQDFKIHFNSTIERVKPQKVLRRSKD